METEWLLDVTGESNMFTVFLKLFKEFSCTNMWTVQFALKISSKCFDINNY